MPINASFYPAIIANFYCTINSPAIGLLKGGLPDTVLAIPAIAIGILGFMVTMGIMFYDQRNSQIYNAMSRRAQMLEAMLGFEPLDGKKDKSGRAFIHGGAFIDRPWRDLKLFGFISIWHDRGLAIIYAAVLGGWAYLITTGILAEVDVGSPGSTLINAGVPAIVFVIFLVQLHLLDKAADVPEEIKECIRSLYLECTDTQMKEEPEKKLSPTQNG